MANIPVFSGLGFRIITFAVVYAVLAGFMTVYAKMIEKNPQKSLCYETDIALREKFNLDDSMAVLSDAKIQKASKAFIGCLIGVLICIVLDFVLVEIRRIISELEKKGLKNVLVDAPTLIESGFSGECDTVISVIAPKDIRLERICKRDSISIERARQRIEAQPSDDFYKINSNYLLINDNNNEEFYLKADELFDKLIIK